MKKTWQVFNDEYIPQDVTSNITFLEQGVYDVRFMPLRGLYLKKIEDEFKFDFKIYGLEQKFIERVVKTYHSTKGNMGVMLNGVKGTGKTITAEILANQLNMPIILVGDNLPGLNSFLTEIAQDISIFIDEYEKVFSGKVADDDWDDDRNESIPGQAEGPSTLLSIMDGAYKTEWRKTFILTTNRMWVNENMINRPGRVRYLKQFGDLRREQVQEIIDDCLEKKEHEESIISFLKPLKLITVDIVKSIISQVNIFDEPAEIACEDLNVEIKDEEYSVYKITGKKESLIEEGVQRHTINHVLTPGVWKGRYI